MSGTFLTAEQHIDAVLRLRTEIERLEAENKRLQQDAERWRRLKASAIHSPKAPLEYAIANVEYFFEVTKDEQ